MLPNTDTNKRNYVNGRLTLLSVDHRIALDVLLARVSLLAVLRFLLLLNQVAESAAAGSGDIGDAGTLEVVLAADICTLHGFWDPVKTKAHGGKEEKALQITY
jgi:hypothetical protein